LSWLKSAGTKVSRKIAENKSGSSSLDYTDTYDTSLTPLFVQLHMLLVVMIISFSIYNQELNLSRIPFPIAIRLWNCLPEAVIKLDNNLENIVIEIN